MGLLVRCSCGKKVHVNAEDVGKRFTCPACREELTAVERNGESVREETERLVRFSCKCGRQLQAKLESVGKSCTCPDCGQTLQIQEQKGGGRGRETRAERGAKKVKKPRGLVFWLVVVLVLLMLGGGGFAGYWFLLREKPRKVPGKSAADTNQNRQILPPILADRDLVSKEAAGFVSVALAKWWTSQAGIRRQEEMGAILPGIAAQEKLGVQADIVQRATLVFPDLDQFYLIVTTERPFDQKRVLQTWAPNAEKKTVQGKTYYESSSTQWSAYLDGDRLFLAGPTATVLEVLKRPAAPKAGGPWQGAWALADDHLIVGGLNPAAPPLQKMKKGASMQSLALRPLLEAKSVTLKGDVTDDIQADLQFVYADEAEAKKRTASVKPSLVLIFSGAKNEVPPERKDVLKPILGLLESMIRTVSVEQKQTSVFVHGKTEPGAMSTATVKLTQAILDTFESAEKQKESKR